MSEMEMVVAFPDGSPAFVHGFEAGGIWRELRFDGPDVLDYGFEIGFPLHTENVGLFQRLAAITGYAVEMKPTELEEWTAVRFTKSRRPALRLVGDPA